MPKIFLKGRPGIGKTTLVKKIAEEFKRRDKKVFGFYTEEMREKGERVGFKVKGLGGEEEIMAHINFSTPYQVSKYKVDLRRFEKVALPELERGRKGDLVIIDEIGKMELFSERFKILVLELIASERLVIATIPITPLSFIADLIKRSGAKVIEVTQKNREGLMNQWQDFFGIKIDLVP